MPWDSSPVEQTDEEIFETTKRLRVGYGLKRTPRYSAIRDPAVHSESVAEHIFALMYLNEYFLPFEDPDRNYDRAAITRMIVFHDFGEIKHGDRPYNQKTLADEAREEVAAAEIAKRMPGPLQAAMNYGWTEYKERVTERAQYVYALDKIEPLFELFDPVNEQSLKRLKYTYKDHVEKKLCATEHFPHMRRFVDVLSTDMLRRGVFWEAQ